MEFSSANIEVARVDEINNRILARQLKIDSLKEEQSALQAENDKDESILQGILEHLGRTKWVSEFGTIELRERKSVKIPRTPEDKKMLFEWLQTKGIFWEYVGVNSASLNSIYKTESEIAEQEGKDFLLPGVGAPTSTITTVLKPKRN